MCPRLKRLILPGVEFMGEMACDGCSALTYLECPKLEQIGSHAFSDCDSLISIDLPSAKVIEWYAFDDCDAIKKANFGKSLETVEKRALLFAQVITIPLKNDLFEEEEEEEHTIFHGCVNLKIVDLVEADVLHETIAALHLEVWRDDMAAKIGSINQILPNTFSGYYDGGVHGG